MNPLKKPVTAGTDRLTRSQEPPQKGLHADSLTTADVPSSSSAVRKALRKVL